LEKEANHIHKGLIDFI